MPFNRTLQLAKSLVVTLVLTLEQILFNKMWEEFGLRQNVTVDLSAGKAALQWRVFTVCGRPETLSLEESHTPHFPGTSRN